MNGWRRVILRTLRGYYEAISRGQSYLDTFVSPFLLDSACMWARAFNDAFILLYSYMYQVGFGYIFWFSCYLKLLTVRSARLASYWSQLHWLPAVAQVSAAPLDHLPWGDPFGLDLEVALLIECSAHVRVHTDWDPPVTIIESFTFWFFLATCGQVPFLWWTLVTVFETRGLAVREVSRLHAV
jgi:hypothetical protein